ncbi:hypothetical protein [Lentibacillus salinarum]|uniref:Uncharacterized protein n=1 Tax=Lentibacillus salinarum TaxID=446820 RepID=A0ABW3ZY99_9BACI
MIQPFQAIVEITEDDQIAEEIAAFPDEVQHDMYNLMKEIMKDELRFVVQLEKYRNRPLQGTLQ